MIYFALSGFILFLCIVGYFVLLRLPITKYYMAQSQVRLVRRFRSLLYSYFYSKFIEMSSRCAQFIVQKESGQPKKGSINDSVDPVYSTDDEEVATGASQQKKVHYFSLMKRIWREALVVFTVFFVSLSLFPGTMLPITTMSLAPRWWLLSHIWFSACP